MIIEINWMRKAPLCHSVIIYATGSVSCGRHDLNAGLMTWIGNSYCIDLIIRFVDILLVPITKLLFNLSTKGYLCWQNIAIYSRIFAVLVCCFKHSVGLEALAINVDEVIKSGRILLVLVAGQHEYFAGPNWSNLARIWSFNHRQVP